MIVIYPTDNTTLYLKTIAEGSFIKHLFSDFSDDVFEANLVSIQNFDSSNTILYLGHGSPEDLQLQTNFSLHYNYAQSIFEKKKLILLSCFSSDFIGELLDKFTVAIGFGNILDSKVDLSPSDFLKYDHDDHKCIFQFRSQLVNLVKNSIAEAYENNYTFLQLYDSMRLRINKIISLCSLSKDKTDLLVGDLMFDLKANLTIKGKWQAFLTE